MERFTVRSTDLGSEMVDDELLIIDFVTNRYYCLNATASTVWDLISATPRSVDEVAARLAAAYGCPIDDVHRDADDLLRALVDEGLLVRTNDQTDTPIDDLAVSAPYVVPRFEKFGTLDQLMLAGE